MRQAKVVIALEQHQLLPQALLTLAQCGDPSPGRVPAGCGYCFGTSPNPSERAQSAGHHPAKPVFTTPSMSLGLHLSTPSPSTPQSSTGILIKSVCGGGQSGTQ